MEDKDEYAKRFDNLIYSIILAILESPAELKRGKKQLCFIADALERKAGGINKVKEKADIIQYIHSDELWASTDILKFENIREELRDLIKFIIDDSSNEKRIIFTNLGDIVISRKEGETLEAAYDFEDYKLKVNRYVEEHRDHLARWKLRNNIRLERGDYEALQIIFTEELGTKEDYKRDFGDTPLGLLIRKIGKLDYDAAMKAFSKFINDESLNQNQIEFVKKIIDHVVKNGYMEDLSELMKPPFDKPMSFVKLFDKNKQAEIIELVNEIRQNAEMII